MSDIEKIRLFEDKKIRMVWVGKEEEWYFVVEDVIDAIVESRDPKQYVKRMKLRDPERSIDQAITDYRCIWAAALSRQKKPSITFSPQKSFLFPGRRNNSSLNRL